jgi:NADPH:quinone reductase-like Zn-dependent oxidoreductase
MKAIRLRFFGGPGTLVYENTPEPQLKEERFWSVSTPPAITWEPTWCAQSGESCFFPFIFGHEFSGVTAAFGSSVTDFIAGELSQDDLANKRETFSGLNQDGKCQTIY